MSEWHIKIIKKAIEAGLEKFYDDKIKFDTTILDFANSDCHIYKIDYYKEFEERRKIVPNEKYLIESWSEAIKERGDYKERRGGAGHLFKSIYEGEQKIKTEKILSSAFQAIMRGENPTIFRLLYSILYSPFDAEPSLAKTDSELNYTNFIEENDFRSIAIGVFDAYCLADLQKGIIPKQRQQSYYKKLVDNGNEKGITLAQELYNVATCFLVKELTEELFEKCAELAYKTTGLLDFIKEFELLKTYNPKSEIENSFDYDSGLRSLIEEFESLISYDLDSAKPEDYYGFSKTYYDSRIKYKQGYLAGIKGESLFFIPVIEKDSDYTKENSYQSLLDENNGKFPSLDKIKDYASKSEIKLKHEIRYNYFVYELVHGALIAYHLPKLKKELEQLQSASSQPEKIVQNDSPNEKINKAHLVRGLFEILTTLGANHDKTNIAKLTYFLIYGKEATSKNEYQTLLNTISALNKQTNSDTAKTEKETIEKYLREIKLLTEKL